MQFFPPQAKYLSLSSLAHSVMQSVRGVILLAVTQSTSQKRARRNQDSKSVVPNNKVSLSWFRVSIDRTTIIEHRFATQIIHFYNLPFDRAKITPTNCRHSNHDQSKEFSYISYNFFSYLCKYFCNE